MRDPPGESPWIDRRNAMAAKIEFDDREARATEAMYLTDDVAATRRAVVAMLKPQPGERILDIGSGPGLLACELAAEVGPSGRMVGVDLSAPMLALAERRCGKLAWVSFETGDAAALPCADGTFDAAVSMQVYEYVPDIPAALAELRRVLRPGGRAVVMATDAGSMVLNTDDRDLTHRIREAWPKHCPHADLPRRLLPLLAAAGFEVSRVETFTLLNTAFSSACFSHGYLGAMSVFAARQGAITKDEGKAWIAGLRRLDAAGAFFFSLNRYLFAVQRG